MSEALDQPFGCKGLKLAVLDNLLTLKEIQLGTPSEFASKVLGRTVNLEMDDIAYDLIPECLDFLRRYPLTTEMLSKVNRIYLSPTLNITNYIFRFWDGVDDLMDVENLKGIELCPNVASFIDEDMLLDRNLAPLARLPHLNAVKVWNYCENISHLKSLTHLKELRIARWRLNEDELKTVDELRAAGVVVTL